MTRTSRNVTVGVMLIAGLAGAGWTASAGQVQSPAVVLSDQDAALARADGEERSGRPSEVLDWNQIFIETLIATNTANSSSPAARGHRSHGDLRCV